MQEGAKNAENLVWLLAAALFLLGPVLQIARNGPRVGLGDYTAAQDYVDTVFEHFNGSGEVAVLLNDWEHITPLWYNQYIDKRCPKRPMSPPNWFPPARLIPGWKQSSKICPAAPFS